ncbi:unnamed protein product [[Candida] boidinii]|nr:hypothetical protein BVG19_g5039 [[Candida] boidinii]OWB48604.1 hypothetical protein B5S27_g139 [[Candida] boidinii]GME90003.1 unnamed protein product [[Candida] boidinii]
MPPKSRKPVKIPLTLKLKRGSQTIFILLQNNATIKTLKIQLVESINGAGGLPVDLEPLKVSLVEDADNDAGESDDDGADLAYDINIPKPSFATNSEDEDDDDDNDEDEISTNGGSSKSRKRAFEDDDDEDLESNATTATVPNGNHPIDNLFGKRVIVKYADIKIAIPRDDQNPYNGQYELIQNDSDKLEELEISDNQIILFTLKDQEFSIIEPLEENK